MSERTTHHATCWERHHECAIKRIRELEAEVLEMSEQAEQLRVQLAGCGCAALGYADECGTGDYGHSVSMDDIKRAVSEWKDRALASEHNFGLQVDVTKDAEAENDALREALARIQRITGTHTIPNPDKDPNGFGAIYEIARAALARKPGAG